MKAHCQREGHQEQVEVWVARALIVGNSGILIRILRILRKKIVNTITMMEFNAETLAFVEIPCDFTNVLNLKFWESHRRLFGITIWSSKTRFWNKKLRILNAGILGVLCHFAVATGPDRGKMGTKHISQQFLGIPSRMGCRGS